MTKTLLVTSGKGGTGKSTVAHLLGRALCRHGKNVLLVELDSGLRGLDLMMGISDRVVFDLSDILCGRCPAAKAITDAGTPWGNLHLIAAPIDRYFIPDRDKLEQLLRSLRDWYDFLLLDTAAGLSYGFDAAASVCDGALLVTNCDSVAVRDAAATARMAQNLSPRLVINRFSRRQLCDDLPDLDAVIDRVGAQLISVIADDPAVSEMCVPGEAASDNSPALLELDDLARRLLGESVRLRTERLK